MDKSRPRSRAKSLFVYALVLAVTFPAAPSGVAQEQRIDLDGNPLNGKESTVETKVIQSSPVEFENVIVNNSIGTSFTFSWPGAGPGGFAAILTPGPDVGTKWTWMTTSQVYTIESPAAFQPEASPTGPRELPVFGQPAGGVQGPLTERSFDVLGKSISPTDVTLSSASLTSSLVTFFSPENTLATCSSRFVPGRFEQTITNNSGGAVTFTVEEPDCCPEPQMTICADGCQFYLTDENNCGGCGNVCAFDEFCDQGTCADICDEIPGDEYCEGVCVETYTDENNCGSCGTTCAFDEECEFDAVSDGGVCADICDAVPGDEYCDEICVETYSDESNCGSCGTTCAFDEECEFDAVSDGGVCADICDAVPGDEYCDGICVETYSDESNCGSCGTTCAFDEECEFDAVSGGGVCTDICDAVPGDEYCDGICVETYSDESNCGSCGTTCAFDEECEFDAVSDGGVCADICDAVPGDEYCDGICVETYSDESNCGSCGTTCAFDQLCEFDAASGGGVCADICDAVPGDEYCDGICVETYTDVTNCGGCGITCAFDEFCQLDAGSGGGVCVEICPDVGSEYCDGICVNTYADEGNCGDCGITCESDELCEFDAASGGGVCAEICPAVGEEFCDGVCADTYTDEGNCGSCGGTCAFDEECEFDAVSGGGVCADICDAVPGDEYCDGICVETYSDVGNCGGCGNTCAFDELCEFDAVSGGGVCTDICDAVPGDEYCGGVCVETYADVDHCGGCGNTCAFDELCEFDAVSGGGVCADICDAVPGDEYCDGVCVETYSDENNCGVCGATCAFDQLCEFDAASGGGVCADICDPDLELCGADCSDLLSDPQNCGACGNVCDPNSICTGGQCEECRGPLKTNCNNVCVNVHKDPNNCGECGNVCDFSGCPSGGTGACSMGTSCICDTGETASSSEPLVFEPTWTNIPEPVFSFPALRLEERSTARSAPASPVPGESPRPAAQASRSEGRERTGPRPRSGLVPEFRGDRVAEQAPETLAVLAVEEAPVCGIDLITQVIPDGESFTLCQTGSNVGREIFTTASVFKDGKTVGQGPCALIVPNTEATVRPFEPSPVSVLLLDESGDGLLQPGETAEAVVEVLNLGPAEMLNPVAVLSSAPDSFNPLPLTFLNDTSVYPDFPALAAAADCDTMPLFEPKKNTVSFIISVPADQEPDIGRVFGLNIQGDVGGVVSVDMPLVIGIGRSCDPATDSDGETYDGLEGLLAPVNTALVPAVHPPNLAPDTFLFESTIRLKVRLKCGSVVLDPADIEEPPQIVSIVHETEGEISLEMINANNNDNPHDPNFECANNLCEFGLRTIGIPVGTFVVAIKMPDSRVFHAAMTTVP